LEQKRIINPDRPLPKNTEFVGHFEYGYKETDIERIPIGKVSLRKAIEFISLHQTNSQEWTAEVIAATHKLNLEDVKNILENFRMFEVMIPEVKGDGKTKKFLIDPNIKTTTDYKTMLEQLKPDAKAKIEPKPEEKDKFDEKDEISPPKKIKKRTSVDEF
jgi:nitrogen regulatory protein PII